jgi:hypothetical protein
LEATTGADGALTVTGRLFNHGTQTAIIPEILLTLYDEQNRVAWVETAFLETAVRPQRAGPFAITALPNAWVVTLLDKGELYTNLLVNGRSRDAAWPERFDLPAGAGYHAFRVSTRYLVGMPP